MIDIETSPCYFFGHITTHPYYIREELYEFVTEFCRVNIFHIEARLRFADPEKDSESNTSYPFTRNYSFGINVVF